MPADAALLDVAQDQLGLFTRAQAREAGIDRNGLDRRQRRGLVRAVTRQVFVVAGVELDDPRRALAAVLDAGPGAALSHHAAAAWWGVPGYTLRDIHVLAPRGRRSRPPAIGSLHTSNLILPTHVVESRGMPIVTPTRCAFDLSPLISYKKLERTIEFMWTERLTNRAKLFRMIDELSKQGRSRLQSVRLYLQIRGPDYRPAGSALELRLRDVVAADGQEPLVQQSDVGDEDEWIGRVDFLDPVLKVIVEVQSDRYHASLLDREADRERIARLEAAGFTVVQVWEHEVWHEPKVVARRIRDARTAARARLAAR